MANFVAALCSREWRHYYQWESCKAEHDNTKWRQDRVRILFSQPASCAVVISSRNVVHRHEPPVTSKPVKVLLHDAEREFITVDKPGSIVRLLRFPD